MKHVLFSRPGSWTEPVQRIGLHAALVLAAGFTLLLGGCAEQRPTTAGTTPAAPKPATPAATPAPPVLSTPQTRVQLPKEQPVLEAALAIEAPVVPPPDPPAPSRPANGTTRRPPVRTETATSPAPTPAPAPAVEPARPQVSEVVSAADIKRLQESAQARKREVTQILDRLKNRRLSKAQTSVVANIRSFVALSDDSEKRNDMRQADALAERAQILARDLQNGK